MGKTAAMASRMSRRVENAAPRRVLVSVAESLTQTDQPEVDAALGELVRCQGDTLVAGAAPDRVISFAEKHSLMIEYERTAEIDLVIAVIDPLMPHGRGNTLPLNALRSAAEAGIDRVAVSAKPWRRR